MRIVTLITSLILAQFIAPSPVMALITVTVHDAHETPVSGALVSITNENDARNTFSAFTGDNGVCVLDMTTIGVEGATPRSFSLGQNYPNPCNPTTTIPFSLVNSSHVRLCIYNVMGQKVRTLVDGELSDGSHTAVWDGRSDNGAQVAAGVYIYRLTSGVSRETRKMVLVDGGNSSMHAGFPVSHKPAHTAEKKDDLPENFTITISGDSIIRYDENDISLVDGGSYDFSVIGINIHEDIEFVTIPSGTFTMGDIQHMGNTDERPAHQVTLDAFEISRYEITNTNYARYLTEAVASGDIAASPYKVTGTTGEYKDQEYFDINLRGCEINFEKDGFTIDAGREKHPVIMVTWYGAKAFAVHYGFDLPTEAEWEYACRAGTTTLYYTGNEMKSNTSADLDRAGWYYYNSFFDDSVGYGKWTHPVGEKEPNAWGLCDTHGNCAEWVNDWVGWSYYSESPESNPTGPETGIVKVLRGGHWTSYASNCRSANRNAEEPDGANYSFGFRVVRRPD